MSAHATAQQDFADAVAEAPDLTPEQKITWLETTARDYLDRLDAVRSDLDTVAKYLTAEARVLRESPDRRHILTVADDLDTCARRLRAASDRAGGQ